MKIKLLKIIAFVFSFFVFYGCNNCENCEKEIQILKKENDSIKEKLTERTSIVEDYNEAKQLTNLYRSIPEQGHIQQLDKDLSSFNKSMISIGRYDVFGDFSIEEDRLTIFIPVTDKKLIIADYENISTNNINALLIKLDRVDRRGLRTPMEPIVKVIEKEFELSKLGFDEDELIKDKKIKIIILNDNTSDITAHIGFYHNCIKIKDDYVKDSCLMPKNKDFIKPNEDGGDIIVGG